MKKIFKRSLTAVMAVASLAVGMTGISAGAISETVYFMRDAGSPGNTGCTSVDRDYTTTVDTSTIKIKDFTVTNSSTHIYGEIHIGEDLRSASIVYAPGGSISAEINLSEIGRAANMTANISGISGTIRATVTLTG